MRCPAPGTTVTRTELDAVEARPHPGQRCLPVFLAPDKFDRLAGLRPSPQRRHISSIGRLVHCFYQDTSHGRGCAPVVARAVPTAQLFHALLRDEPGPVKGPSSPVGKRRPRRRACQAAGQVAPRSARGRRYAPVLPVAPSAPVASRTATLPPKLCPATTIGPPASSSSTGATHSAYWRVDQGSGGSGATPWPGRSRATASRPLRTWSKSWWSRPQPCSARTQGPPVPYLAPHRRPPAKVLSAMSSGRQTTRRPDAILGYRHCSPRCVPRKRARSGLQYCVPCCASAVPVACRCACRCPPVARRCRASCRPTCLPLSVPLPPCRAGVVASVLCWACQSRLASHTPCRVNYMVVTMAQPTALLADLTPSQHLAVTTPSPTVCVLASAGAGKTRVLTRRVGYRVVTGAARPEHVTRDHLHPQGGGRAARASERPGTSQGGHGRDLPLPGAQPVAAMVG